MYRPSHSWYSTGYFTDSPNIECLQVITELTLTLPLSRYLAVVFPVSSKVLRTKFNTQVAISVSWAVSLLLSCPALFLHGLVESKAEDNQVGPV